MRALSLTQPWAWLVIHGGKDIENRRWNTSYRGRFFVHASKRMTEADYDTAFEVALRVGGLELANRIPDPKRLDLGGIIGSVELVDVVRPLTEQQQELGERQFAWHFPEQFGFRLRNPEALPFQPCKGALGFWGAVVGGGGLHV